MRKRSEFLPIFRLTHLQNLHKISSKKKSELLLKAASSSLNFRDVVKGQIFYRLLRIYNGYNTLRGLIYEEYQEMPVLWKTIQ